MSHLENIEELGKLLKQSGRTTLAPDQIHGMMTAIVCGPKTIKPTHWLPYIFHETEDLKELLEDPQFEPIVENLVELYNDLLFTIRQGTFQPYIPEKKQKGTTVRDAQGWCTGFFYGMNLHGDEWMNNESEQLATHTAAILYLANPEEATKELDDDKKKEFADKYDQFVESIRYAVPPIYDFFNLGVKPEVKKDFFAQETDSPAGQS